MTSDPPIPTAPPGASSPPLLVVVPGAWPPLQPAEPASTSRFGDLPWHPGVQDGAGRTADSSYVDILLVYIIYIDNHRHHI